MSPAEVMTPLYCTTALLHKRFVTRSCPCQIDTSPPSLYPNSATTASLLGY